MATISSAESGWTKHSKTFNPGDSWCPADCAYIKLAFNWWNINGNPEGTAYVDDWNITGNDNTETTNYIKFASKTTSQIKLVMTKTITANQEKKIGEFMVMQETYEFPSSAFEYHIKHPKVKEGNYRLGTGKMVNWHIAEKYGCEFIVSYINQTFLDKLRTIYDTHKSFNWYPQPDKPDNIYLVLWTSKWNPAYTTNLWANGYTLTAELEEV
jgi:hypothetical protein